MYRAFTGVSSLNQSVRSTPPADSWTVTICRAGKWILGAIGVVLLGLGWVAGLLVLLHMTAFSLWQTAYWTDERHLAIWRTWSFLCMGGVVLWLVGPLVVVVLARRLGRHRSRVVKKESPPAKDLP
jgi:hypothetical protein